MVRFLLLSLLIIAAHAHDVSLDTTCSTSDDFTHTSSSLVQSQRLKIEGVKLEQEKTAEAGFKQPPKNWCGPCNINFKTMLEDKLVKTDAISVSPAGSKLKFRNVCWIESYSMNLEMTFETEYAAKAFRNGIYNGMYRLNVMQGSSTEVTFKLKDGAGWERKSKILFSLLDVDSGPGDVIQYIVPLTPADKVIVGEGIKQILNDKGEQQFESNTLGDETDNPTDPNALSTIQAQKIVAFEYSSSKWKVRFGVKGNNPSVGRFFMLGGKTQFYGTDPIYVQYYGHVVFRDAKCSGQFHPVSVDDGLDGTVTTTNKKKKYMCLRKPSNAGPVTGVRVSQNHYCDSKLGWTTSNLGFKDTTGDKTFDNGKYLCCKTGFKEPGLEKPLIDLRMTTSSCPQGFEFTGKVDGKTLCAKYQTCSL